MSTYLIESLGPDVVQNIKIYIFRKQDEGIPVGLGQYPVIKLIGYFYCKNVYILVLSGIELILYIRLGHGMSF